MTHDPLCVNQPEHHDGSILWPARCDCDLIARVREDERSKSEAAGSVWSAKSRLMEQRGEATGYAAALRDAVEAVKAADLCGQNNCASDAVAAIEALGVGK